MHVVSLTPHAKYDTACTIDEQFERPLQVLKGIFIKNINVHELAYPTPKKNISIYAFENRSYLGEFKAEFKKALALETGAHGILFDEKKTKGRKSCDTVPLMSSISILNLSL
jgi:hypothetical protein